MAIELVGIVTREQMTLGEFVKARRTAMNFTQLELERISGVPQRTISRIEGTRKEGYLPEPATLLALARGLHVTVRDLLAAAGYGDNYGDEELIQQRRMLTSPRADLILTRADQLTEDQFRALMTLIEALTDGSTLPKGE